MASPAAPPDQPVQEDAAVSHDQLAQAINQGTNICASTSVADDYLKYAQGVKLLSDALVALHTAENPPPQPNGGPQTPTQPGGQGNVPGQPN